MGRAKVLLTITDGEDNGDEKDYYLNKSIKKLKNKGIYSLSVGIGSIDVDHEGLSHVANNTGGIHIMPRNSTGVAQALSNITEIIHTQIARQVVMNNSSYFERTRFQQNNLRAAIDLFILIDCSPSMEGLRSDGSWDGDKMKLINTQHSAINVLRTLHPNYDRVAVASFWEDYELHSSFTNDFQHCANEIAGIETESGTSLYKAMCKAADAF